MKTNLPLKIVNEFCNRLDVQFNITEIKTKFKNMDFSETPSIKNMLIQITEIGRLVNISFIERNLSTQEFLEVLDNKMFPLLLFVDADNNGYNSYMITNYRGGVVEGILIEDEAATHKQYHINQLLSSCYLSSEEVFSNTNPKKSDNALAPQTEIYIITPLVIKPSFGGQDGLDSTKDISPVKRLYRLLASERKDIGYIYIYSIAIGLLSLTTPLGVQAIISLISGGVIPETVVVLIIFVIVATSFSGGLQIMQVYIVETLKQRVFAKAAFEFAYQIPHIKMESIADQYAPELMNRFFDVLTIQKGYTKILIDMLGAVLQILFGLLLLSFYHPFFIFFGFLLLFIIGMIFYFTGAKGVKTSLMESKYKYNVVHWLEEIARTLNSFKLAGYSNLSLEKTDLQVSYYLQKRQAHFKILISQYISMVLFKVLVTGGVLILGSILVVNKQITLGQFIASELVILAVMQGVEKIILNLDSVYDLLTAVDKVGHVTDLPLETIGGVSLSEINPNEGFAIKLRGLKYAYPKTNNYILNGIDLDIKPGEKVGIVGESDAGKTTFINVVTGLYDSFEGSVSYNGLSIRDINISSLRDEIGDNLSSEEIFQGTLIENITVGKPTISVADVMWALDKVSLTDFVHSLPEGIHTNLIAGGKKLSTSIQKKIILARSIAEHPRLVIFDEFFVNMPNSFVEEITKFIFDKSQTWTIIASTMNPIVLSNCDRVIILKEGRIIQQGTFNELILQPELQEFIPIQILINYVKS